jgi:hypothetical protein
VQPQCLCCQFLMHIKNTPTHTLVHCVGIGYWYGSVLYARGGQRDNLILRIIWLITCSSTENRRVQEVIRQNVSDALPWFITAVVLAANHFREAAYCGWEGRERQRDLQA